MSDLPDLTLKMAVLEWQKKYGIKDGDPLLASLELFQIYFHRWQNRPEQEGTASSYDEFRGSFEALEHRTKALSKIASEMIEALRMVPGRKEPSPTYHTTALVVATVLALSTGLCLGKFFL